MKQSIARFFSPVKDADPAVQAGLFFAACVFVMVAVIAGDLWWQHATYASQLLPNGPEPTLLSSVLATSNVTGFVLAMSGLIIGRWLYGERPVTGTAVGVIICTVALVGTALLGYMELPNATPAVPAALSTAVIWLSLIPIVLLLREWAWMRFEDFARPKSYRALFQIRACSSMRTRLACGAIANGLLALVAVSPDQPAWLAPLWPTILWTAIIASVLAVLDSAARLAEVSA